MGVIVLSKHHRSATELDYTVDGGGAELVENNDTENTEDLASADATLAEKQLENEREIEDLKDRISELEIADVQPPDVDADTDHHQEKEDEDGCKCLEGEGSWAFDINITKGNQVMVLFGPIYVQGVTRIDFPTTVDTAVGEYCFPTIKIPIANVAGATLEMYSALQDVDITNVYIPLARLKSGDYPDNTLYDFDGDASILHRGAIHLSNPLVFQ